MSPERGSALPQRGVGRMLGNWLWITAFVGFFLVFGAWAAATPPHAAFDEQPHVIRAAGASAGQVVPRVVNGESVQTVPRGYDTSLCFIGKPTVSAACLGPFAGAERVELKTSAGRYFPLYYVVVGWPLNVSPGWTGLLAARLISAALSAAFLASALVTLVRRSRHGLMLAGLVVATSITVANLAGAVNPNGLEITAGIALFSAGIPLLLGSVPKASRASTTSLVWLFGVSAATLATLKANGPLWLAMAVLPLVVPLRRTNVRTLLRLRSVRWCVGAVSTAAVASAAWTVVVGADRLIPIPVGQHLTWTQAAWHQLELSHSHLHEIVGILGWGEIRVPHVVYPLWWFVASCPLILALVVGDRLGRWRVLTLIGLVTGVPFALQVYEVNSMGFIIQGRYLLSLVVGVPLLACFLLEQGVLDAKQSRSLTRFTALVLLPLHMVSLAYCMVRWQDGLRFRYPGVRNLNPLAGNWHPAVGSVTPLIALGLGVAVIGWLLWHASTQPVEQAGLEHPPHEAAAPGDGDVLALDAPRAPLSGQLGDSL